MPHCCAATFQPVAASLSWFSERRRRIRLPVLMFTGQRVWHMPSTAQVSMPLYSYSLRRCSGEKDSVLSRDISTTTPRRCTYTRSSSIQSRQEHSNFGRFAALPPFTQAGETASVRVQFVIYGNKSVISACQAAKSRSSFRSSTCSRSSS